MRHISPSLSVCLLLALPAAQACVRESVVAVEPKHCRSGDCSDAGATDATVPPDAGHSAKGDAGAADGGKAMSDAGRPDAASGTDDDAGTTLPPLLPYTLVVDFPYEGAVIHGVGAIRGRSADFVNVELWDSTHQMPPLARATPEADGTFALSVDVTALPPGPTTWTVWGWDSPAGQPYAHTASVTMHVTLK